MKKILKCRGFTLIELLVVIAIVGILASVVLISLNGARGKANDVKIMSDVKQIRTQLESDYTGAAYSDLTRVDTLYINGGFANDPANPNPGTSTITTLLGDAYSQGGSINVVTNPATGSIILGYALYGQLVSSSTLYFCMDSTGRTNERFSSNPATFTSTCP